MLLQEQKEYWEVSCGYLDTNILSFDPKHPIWESPPGPSLNLLPPGMSLLGSSGGAGWGSPVLSSPAVTPKADYQQSQHEPIELSGVTSRGFSPLKREPGNSHWAHPELPARITGPAGQQDPLIPDYPAA